jgi:hypothetical protein
MTEEEWRECDNLKDMLTHLFEQEEAWKRRLLTWIGLKPKRPLTRRLIRLFACGCCRLQRPQDAMIQKCLESIELYVDGLLSEEEFQRVIGETGYRGSTLAGRTVAGQQDSDVACSTYLAAWYAAIPPPEYWPVWDNRVAVCLTKMFECLLVARAIPELGASCLPLEQEYAARRTLLRHIIGNPFRPYPAPPSWPSTVVQLAESLYAGQDCAFALHDALLEAGHAELAEHFREEKSHPKGCWVVDLILGKE